MKTVVVEKKEALIELTSGFCKEKLNDEYASLCAKVINKMGRKRHVPFETGKLSITPSKDDHLPACDWEPVA